MTSLEFGEADRGARIVCEVLFVRFRRTSRRKPRGPDLFPYVTSPLLTAITDSQFRTSPVCPFRAHKRHQKKKTIASIQHVIIAKT